MVFKCRRVTWRVITEAANPADAIVPYGSERSRHVTRRKQRPEPTVKDKLLTGNTLNPRYAAPREKPWCTQDAVKPDAVAAEANVANREESKNYIKGHESKTTKERGAGY